MCFSRYLGGARGPRNNLLRQFSTLRSSKQGGGGRKKIPPGGELFSSAATLVTPQPRIQKFPPAGDFFYPNPPLSPLGPKTPPLDPPPVAPAPLAPPLPPPLPPPPPPPNPIPLPLLRCPHRNFVEAAPATMAERRQSHAPDPGADPRRAGFQTHGLFTCICTGAH